MVTDITTNGDFRMKDWSCDFAAKAFQGGRMRVEYDMSNHDESNKQKFEDDSWKSLKVCKVLVAHNKHPSQRCPRQAR